MRIAPLPLALLLLPACGGPGFIDLRTGAGGHLGFGVVLLHESRASLIIDLRCDFNFVPVEPARPLGIVLGVSLAVALN